MARTQVRSPQIEDQGVARADVNDGVSGKAVIKKLIQGRGIVLNSTGADSGTGDVTASVDPNGIAVYLDYTFSTTTTDSDPGDGVLRLDNATQLSATIIRADLKDSGGVDLTAVLAAIVAGRSGSKLRLYKSTDFTKWIEFALGAAGDAVSGYVNISVTETNASGANPLANSDAVTLAYFPRWMTSLNENVDLAGDISPSQITSDQNNYAPTGFSTACVLKINSDVARSITGIAGGGDGKLILLLNTGTQPITLANNSSSSTAANRFGFSGKDIQIGASAIVILLYDSTASRWRSLNVAPIFAFTNGIVYTLPTTDAIASKATGQTFLGVNTFNVGSSTGQGIVATGTSGPLNSVQNGAYQIDFGLATSSGFFSNIAIAGDAIVRRVNGSGSLIISNESGGSIQLATGTASNNDTVKVGISQAGDVTFSGIVIASKQIRKKGYTVATLPTPTVGDCAYVTDALAPVFGSTVAGSGAVTVPVFYNGSNWIVG